MRTMILSGMILAATMSGCATMGKVGANTTNYRVWWKDCGVSRDVPGNLEVFKGQTPSPNSTGTQGLGGRFWWITLVASF